MSGNESRGVRQETVESGTAWLHTNQVTLMRCLKKTRICVYHHHHRRHDNVRPYGSVFSGLLVLLLGPMRELFGVT